MHNLVVIESRGKRVLTSAQIAECYDTTVDCIKQNFHANRNRFIEGKHYIALTGTELREFKNKVRNPYPDKSDSENEVSIPHSAEIKARYQFNTQFKYAKSLYLWTEKGALLHAKSLNTDKAWQVYDYLVDFYFRAKENEPEISEKKVPEKKVSKKIDVSSEAKILKAIHKVRRDLICMDVLLEKCANEKWESRYTDTKFEVADLAWIIAADCNAFLDLRPKTIQEYQ